MPQPGKDSTYRTVQIRPAISDAVADAFEFLTEEWLCDVATDFAGKCVLIAMTLTILQRVLFAERPAFFVTAGKRGGGKTTALAMAITAVTGKRPAAAAWSNKEDERRKTVLTYLMEGLPAVVWDNIPVGTAIACPRLERVLTAESYSDRVLGQSLSVTVPAHTVMAFTGNNITPSGELASRSLMVRLDVDRPDPENRKFKHTDPAAWTLDNRGEILRCLYIILLGNPRLQASTAQAAKTRFKTWWHLVGSAIEHASACLASRQSSFPNEWRTAVCLDFAALFLSLERDDEETAGLAEVLDVLHAGWPTVAFKASDIANLISQPMSGEDERAAILRAYFESPSGRGPGTFTPKSIGKRLIAILDTPVWVENRVMKLVRLGGGEHGHQKLVSWFKVQTG